MINIFCDAFIMDYVTVIIKVKTIGKGIEIRKKNNRKDNQDRENTSIFCHRTAKSDSTQPPRHNNTPL